MDLRRSINTKIWDDVWFESLNSDQKLIWLYLLTNKNTNMLGVYELSEKKIAFEVGLSLETVRKAFESFESIKKAKYLNGYVVLYNWIKNQSYNTNMKKSALSDYEKLPSQIKISVKTIIEFNLSESFGTLSKDLLTLPKNEKEDEKEIEDEKDIVSFENFIDEFSKEKPMRRPILVRASKDYFLNEKETLELFKSWCLRNEGKKMSLSHAENSFNLFLKANKKDKEALTDPNLPSVKYPKSTFKDNDF